MISRFLTAAARGVMVKGGTLEERLFVPEQFRVPDAEEIGERRRRKLAILLSPEDDVQFKMAILIGQLTLPVQSTTYGRRMTVKHMPDVPVYIDNKAWEKAERAYKAILQAVDADVEHKPHVVMAALIYAKREHTYQVDSLTLMLVTDQWIPLDGLYELPQIEELTRQGQAFIKPLKFDAKTAAGFPNVLLLDAGASPVPLNIVSPFMDAKDRAIKEKVIKTAAGAAWCWETDKEIRLCRLASTLRGSPGLRQLGLTNPRLPATREQQRANDSGDTQHTQRRRLGVRPHRFGGDAPAARRPARATGTRSDVRAVSPCHEQSQALQCLLVGRASQANDRTAEDSRRLSADPLPRQRPGGQSC
ncbi:MAG: DUF1173 family protein [Burkholderiales bacterium]|nr:DUF1173 family protein [Burkholderiales bacterium]